MHGRPVQTLFSRMKLYMFAEREAGISGQTVCITVAWRKVMTVEMRRKEMTVEIICHF